MNKITTILIVAAITIVAVLLGGLYLDLVMVKKDYTAVQAKLASCSASQEVQNAAILQEQKVSIQKQLDVNSAQTSAANINQKIIQDARLIASMPDITDCKKATQWGAKQSASIAIDWAE